MLGFFIGGFMLMALAWGIAAILNGHVDLTKLQHPDDTKGKQEFLLYLILAVCLLFLSVWQRH